MAVASAFVAHSFLEIDREHVEAFLSFLIRIRNLNPAFSWDHARDAEPVDLQSKVLSKAKNANLLIAICSRKEMVFTENNAKSSLFSPNHFLVPKQSCTWTTSEWIVQEIGMAIARGMKVILLIEDQVRQPGGMQGNLEYIEFNRNQPEKAFKRLMEMISSITTDVGFGITTANTFAETSLVEVDSALDIQPPDLQFIPNKDMSEDVLTRKLFSAYRNKDMELVEKIEVAFMDSVAGSNEELRSIWYVRRQWYQQIFFGNANLQTVRTNVELFNNNALIAKFNAQILLELGEHKAAGNEFVRSASLESLTSEKIKKLLEGAIALLKAGEKKVVHNLLIDAQTKLSTDPSIESEHAILLFLAEYFKGEEDLLRVAILERLLQLYPENQDERFNLAYSYGEIGSNIQSLHQYLRIPEKVRTAAIWNNLGVAYGNLKLTGKSVDAYDQAITLGSSLAVSNRARLLRDAGFLSIAESDCKEALMDTSADSSLAETLSSIITCREQETKQLDDFIAVAHTAESKMRIVGEALTQLGKSTWAGVWIGPKYKLIISEKDSEISGLGVYETPVGIARRGLGDMFSNAKNPVDIINVSLSAKINGCTAIGLIEEKPSGTTESFLTIDAYSKQIIYTIDGSGKSIQVLEFQNNKEIKSYTFTLADN